jgi:hypothetical protein
MSSEDDAPLHAAPFAAMLSVSINNVRPLKRSPHNVTTRLMPKSSLQLIERFFSAAVNSMAVSSRCPSNQMS